MANLTPRELAALAHLAEGRPIAEVASRLAVGAGSIRTHVARAIKKLGAKTQLHAVAIAIRQDLI